jgi:very-short-patch-repair endonuclease
VFDAYGNLIGRVDMGYEDFRVGIEYDGPQHWTDPARRARDIGRQANLEAEGWIIIRVSSDLLRYGQATFIARVRTAMQSRGWSGRVCI